MPTPAFSSGPVMFNNTEGGFSGVGDVSAAQITLKAPPSPANGPSVPFVYTNQVGTFKLSAGAAPGAAQYVWQGILNNDVLAYVGFGSVLDNTGIGVPKGSEVDVWIYSAADASGNQWFLAFGVDPLSISSARPKYPVYYAYSNPSVNGKAKRWITPRGTERI